MILWRLFVFKPFSRGLCNIKCISRTLIIFLFCAFIMFLCSRTMNMEFL